MTPVRAFLGDAEHSFRLTGALIIELETKCRAGIGAIADRVFSRRFSYSDLAELLRLALIGGGLATSRAHELVAAYVENQPIVEAWEIASTILERLMFGDPPAPNTPKEETK